MDIFLLHFGQLVTELNRLLQLKFIPSDPGHIDHPLGRSLEVILGYHVRGRTEPRDWEMSNLIFLASQLRALENSRPKLFRRFRKELRRPENYPGARFEVNIAKTLVTKGYSFNTPDPPDFLVTWNNNKVGIECATRHLSDAKAGDPWYKVEQAINEKESKQYASSKVALFIDFTNIHHVAALNEVIDSSGDYYREIRERVRERAEISAYGSIILFSVFVDLYRNRFGSHYFREDKGSIDSNLCDFLDDAFPKGDYPITNAQIPWRA